MKRLEKLYKKFEAYCKELVVFGFNSAGYDITHQEVLVERIVRTWSATNLHCQGIWKVSMHQG